MAISTTAMMLNKDGSAFHLHAYPNDIAQTIIFVGDPQRIDLITCHFDKIELSRRHREFVVTTGRIGQQRLTVIGTGISSSNIDIVLNELDLLVNFNFAEQRWRQSPVQLDIIRLGSSGALQADIPVGSFVLSEQAFALDSLLNYYHYQNTTAEQALFTALHTHFNNFPMREGLYVASANSELFKELQFIGSPGITFTCCGFYGPQHRALRVPLIKQDILQTAVDFDFNQQRITNFEMETAAIYGLGAVLGHRCCSVNAIIANRITDKVHSQPEHLIKQMIEKFFSIF